MALIQLDFLSKCLNMHTAVNIALPMPKNVSSPMKDIPCLVLLHDMGEDMTAWQRYVPVERYALENGVAVVMPDGALSFYENMRHGGRYADYIAKELPEVLLSYFPISRQREKNFIAGYGMGGRGAMKLSAGHPENYSAVGVFCASHAEIEGESENIKSALFRSYGGDISACRRKIEENYARIAGKGPGIKLYHACSEAEDAAETRKFFENAGGNIEYRFEKFPGKNDWAMREKMLAAFMQGLNIPAPEEEMK